MHDKATHFNIDKAALDEELVQQPTLYYNYAHQLADAKHEVLLCQATLDVTKAELDAAIRATPSEFGLEKVTEASLAAIIVTQREYKSDLRELQAAKHAVDVLQAAVSALDHKKSALGKLVDLWLANYFSDVRPGTGGAKRFTEETTKANTRRRAVQPEDGDE